jgi:hypothetical protein
MRAFLLFAIVSTAWFGVTLAQDTEKKVDVGDVPAAVQRAISEHSAGATLRGVTQEVEQGQTLYEAELAVDTHTKDVTFDASGNVVSVEEQTSLDRIPATAREAIERAAKGGTLESVEEVRESGKTYYEAHIKKGAKTSEVKVGESGEPLK